MQEMVDPALGERKRVTLDTSERHTAKSKVQVIVYQKGGQSGLTYHGVRVFLGGRSQKPSR